MLAGGIEMPIELLGNSYDLIIDAGNKA